MLPPLSSSPTNDPKFAFLKMLQILFLGLCDRKIGGALALLGTDLMFDSRDTNECPDLLGVIPGCIARGILAPKPNKTYFLLARE